MRTAETHTGTGVGAEAHRGPARRRSSTQVRAQRPRATPSSRVELFRPGVRPDLGQVATPDHLEALGDRDVADCPMNWFRPAEEQHAGQRDDERRRMPT